jgi:GTPase Era involved in 16S rRNA processing
MRKFLLVGRTGVGKSSFINSAFGNVAKISDFEPCTKSIEIYAYNTLLGDVCLIDTPGLAEDEVSLDYSYLDLILNKVDLSTIHAILYVSRLDETRFYPDEKRTLRALTERLGSDIWNSSIIVFTFAASVSREKRKEKIQKKYSQISNFLLSIMTGMNSSIEFQGFSQCWVIDNQVSNWTEEGIPILSVLTE